MQEIFYIPFLHSVEFYVLMLFAAAAVLAVCVRPSRKGEALTHTLAGTLVAGDPEAGPALHLTCLDNGDVEIRRTGLRNLTPDSHIALAVTQIGFDLAIKERPTVGGPSYSRSRNADFATAAATLPSEKTAPANPTEAVFIIRFMGPEWYHINYVDETTNVFAAFSFHVRPGLKQTVELHH